MVPCNKIRAGCKAARSYFITEIQKNEAQFIQYVSYNSSGTDHFFLRKKLR